MYYRVVIVGRANFVGALYIKHWHAKNPSHIYVRSESATPFY